MADIEKFEAPDMSDDEDDEDPGNIGGKMLLQGIFLDIGK